MVKWLDWSRALPYAASKLAGSSFLFMVTIFVVCQLKYETWPGLAGTEFLWIAYYGYAIACSVIIDFLTRKTSEDDRILYKIPLYIFLGILPFLILFGAWSLFAIFPSLIGAACALIFYWVSYFAYRVWPYSGIAAVAVLIFLIYLAAKA